MKGNNKKYLFVLTCILLIIIGIFLRVINLNQDITAEEPDFVKPAIAIANTGRPLFYHSEQLPNQLALYHPPMYLYLLALIAKFSTSEIALRSLNFMFSILTAVVIFLFCIRINKTHGKQIGVLSVALFLLNYYVFSSSLIIDIDVLSMFFLFSFIYFVFSYYQTKKISYAILASLAFLFSLANRYPIAILTFLSIGTFFFLKKETRKFTRDFFLIGLIGGVIFFILWTIYSTIIEPGTFFAFLKHNAKLGAEQFSSLPLYIASFCLNISQIIRLFTLPALILFISSIIYFAKRKEDYIKILLIYSITTLLFFIAIPRPAFGYPRYFLTMMPGLFILISMYIYENLINKRPYKRHFIWAGLILFCSFYFLLVLNPQSTLYDAKGLIKATNLPDFIFNIFCLTPLFLLFFFKKRERRLFLIIALICSLVAYSIYFDIKYTLNDSKTKETGDYIKAHTSINDIVIAPKAVGYYAERNFYVNDNNKPPIENISLNYLYEYLTKSLKNRSMDDEFFWSRGFYGGLYPPMPSEEILKNVSYSVTYHKITGVQPEEVIGELYIYNLK